MKLQEWLGAIPKQFPESMGYSTDNSCYQNPVIAETQEQTYENVENVIQFFIQMALPSYTEKADFSLNEAATWGYITLLQCLASAMTFEHKHRAEGGEPIGEDTSKPNKVSFKPYHGQPFKKYSIFSKKPDGTVKHLGKMMAPNNDLALAKATENFGETVEANCSLFVAQRT